MIKIKVRCVNPYFKGTVHGVEFKQASGGAIGMATAEQAAELADEKAFFIDTDDADGTLTGDAEGGAAESSDDTGTPVEGEGSPTGNDDGKGTTSDLTAIKGIGPDRAAALASLGINSLEDLADASTDDIARKGITTQKQALSWRKQAADIVADLAVNEE